MPETSKLQYTVNRRTVYVFMLFIAFLLALNVMLLKQNKDLKSEVISIRKSFELSSGTKLPSLKGYDLAGKEVEISFGQQDAKKTLIFVFSVYCGYCDVNMPLWQQIAIRFDRKALRVIAITPQKQEVSVYLAKYPLDASTIIAGIDPQSIIDYKLKVTPQTILVNQLGQVEKVWSGRLQSSDVDEITDLLNSI